MIIFMSRTQWWIMILLILSVGFFLRIWKLGEVPVSLYWDEAAMLVDVKSVVQSGQDQHGRPWFQLMYPSYGDYKLPVYIWLASATALVAGVSEWSLRLPSVLAGLLTIVMAGAIARRLVFLSESQPSQKAEPSVVWFAQVVQLTTMAVVALSPWSILFSRTAFEGHAGQALLAVSVWLLLGSTRKWWLVGLAAGAGVLATYAYFSVRFVWPVVAVAWLSWLGWQQVRTAFNVPKLLKFVSLRLVVAVVLFGLGLIPMMRSPLYEASNAFRLGTDSVLQNEKQIAQSNVYRELAGNTPIDRVIFHRWGLTLKELLINYSDHLSLSYLFLTGDANLRHSTTQDGLFLLPFIVPFGVGLLVLATQRRTLLAVLIGWWLIALLPASVPETTPHALRSLNALVPLSLITGWGVAVQFRTIWLAWEKTVHKATLPPLIQAWMITGLMTVFGLWVAGSVIAFHLHYFQVYAVESAPEWQQGYREVAQTIERLRAENKASVVVLPFDDRFYLWVMAYGSYTAEDFHSWESAGWQFKQFAGIDFTGQKDWSKVVSGEGQVVLAGRSEHLAEVLTGHEQRISYQEVIPDAQGQDLYTVVVIKR
jgi:DNA polymerase III psi subunit